MADYVKVSLKSVQFPEQIHKEFYWNLNAKLDEIEPVLRRLIGADWDHLSSFYGGKGREIEFGDFGQKRRLYVEDIGFFKARKVGYTYDFGDNWRFVLNFGRRKESLPSNAVLILESGSLGLIHSDAIRGYYEFVATGKSHYGYGFAPYELRYVPFKNYVLPMSKRRINAFNKGVPDAKGKHEVPEEWFGALRKGRPLEK